MDQNAPILAANDRLGFTVVPGYYAVGRAVAAARRRLTPAAGGPAYPGILASNKAPAVAASRGVAPWVVSPRPRV